MSKEKEVKDFVKKRYGSIAKEEKCCCQSSCCSWEASEGAKTLGYNEEDLANIPEEAAALGLGCGNPTALAEIKEGEVVLDLGSGGGVDVFLAANRVGPEGSVIGIDMTDEMLDRARETAAKHGYRNVDFRKGDIEAMPVEDASVDLVVSNCVINLAYDKLKVFKEAFRVLKPRGRILISDIVTEGEIPDDVRASFEAWAGCIAGALERTEYLDTIRKAGFTDIRIVREHAYSESGMDERLKGKIISVQVASTKPCCCG
jgi:SAM-dependent methyltransferase